MRGRRALDAARRPGYGRVSTRSAADTARAALFAATSPNRFFDADRFSADTLTSYITPANTLVKSAGTFATPVADAAFGGAKALLFTGTQWMDSNEAVSAWNPSCDGTGFSLIHVYSMTSLPANVVLGCTQSAGGGTGSQLLLNGGTHYLQIIGIGSIVFAGGAGGALNTPTYSGYTYSEAASPKYDVRVKASSVASGAPTGAPASPCAIPFRLGAASDGTLPASMRWRATMTWNRVLTAPDYTALAAYAATLGIV